MTSGPRPPLLDVSSIAVDYGDLRAVWDVSFSVWRGKVTALLGPNGAGKTTTLLATAGALNCAQGIVSFEGHPVTHLPPHRRVELGMALVQENKRVFRRRTVEQNLLLGGYRLSRGDRKTALEKAYQSFPILYTKRRTVAAGLSGGQQQMLAIAQVLTRKPILVMLDEPSAGLAPIIVRDVFRSMRALADEGIGVLLVEQVVEEAEKIADHFVFVDQGRVVSRRDGGGPRDSARAMI